MMISEYFFWGRGRGQVAVDARRGLPMVHESDRDGYLMIIRIVVVVALQVTQGSSASPWRSSIRNSSFPHRADPRGLVAGKVGSGSVASGAPLTRLSDLQLFCRGVVLLIAGLFNARIIHLVSGGVLDDNDFILVGLLGPGVNMGRHLLVLRRFLKTQKREGLAFEH